MKNRANSDSLFFFSIFYVLFTQFSFVKLVKFMEKVHCDVQRTASFLSFSFYQFSSFMLSPWCRLCLRFDSNKLTVTFGQSIVWNFINSFDVFFSLSILLRWIYCFLALTEHCGMLFVIFVQISFQWKPWIFKTSTFDQNFCIVSVERYKYLNVDHFGFSWISVVDQMT